MRWPPVHFIPNMHVTPHNTCWGAANVLQRKSNPKITGGVQVHHHAVGTCSHPTSAT